MEKYRQKLKKVLKGYKLEQYRENRAFIEFWLVDSAQQQTTSICLERLLQISKVLGTSNLHVTGGNFTRNFREEDVHTKVLVTVYGPRVRRKAT